MKHTLFKCLIIIFSSVTLLTSCATKQGSGALIGSLAGGIIGSQFGGSGGGSIVAAGIGAAAGAMIGGSIGQSLDERDKKLLADTTQTTLENSASGTTVKWKNPDSGNSGYITPIKTYQTDNGRYCREYSTKIIVGGKEENAYGKACRQPDGNWEIVK
jgi:surface antigen